MSEKVKLPKFICDGINDLKVELSIKATESPTEIADFMEKLNHVNSEIHSWIYYSTTNQWDLFDALRYGYEAETEPIYYVRFIQNNSHSFLNSSESDGLEISDNEETEYIKTKFTMPEILAIDPRYKAFAAPVEKVDVNEE
ncbi:DUF1642 domain-containing protein [Latilactobacillus sakei]|uniref:DUF1642 domain-containing protein n=1 Tax=Latilactobacillus sakei TaxID=1599 RepID=UPI003884BA53